MKKHLEVKAMVLAGFMALVAGGVVACAGVQSGEPPVEGAQAVLLEGSNGQLYEFYYIADLTPDQMAAIMEVGLVDDDGQELPALTPVVNEVINPEDVPVVDSIGIAGIRMLAELDSNEEGEIGEAEGAVTVNRLILNTWYKSSRTISTSGAWSSTCTYWTNVIAVFAVLFVPSSADFNLYAYSNSSCTGSTVGSQSSGGRGATEMMSVVSTNVQRKTYGFKVKSYSGTGTYNLHTASLNYN